MNDENTRLPSSAKVVEQYLTSRKEIARICTDADAAEAGTRGLIKQLDDEMDRKMRELEDEKYSRYKVLNNRLASIQEQRKADLAPFLEQKNRVKRIITLLKIAETIQTVTDIENGDITTHHGEYLEWLDHVYKDEYLKIRLLITENRKPKNKYSLLAYGRCSFWGTELLDYRRVYLYGTPNLNDHSRGFSVRCELGSYPSIQFAKKAASRFANKTLKQYIADFEALKQEYREVTANYKLSDFEKITAMEKEGSQ